MNVKGTIVFVDDDPDDQYIFRASLKKVAPEVELICLPDGKSLERFFYQRNPAAKRTDLILLDLNMAVQDGKTTLKHFKSDGRFKHLPVLMYSTSSSHADINEAYELGANSFIVKPASVEDVENLIRNICAYWFSSVSLMAKTDFADEQSDMSEST